MLGSEKRLAKTAPPFRRNRERMGHPGFLHNRWSPLPLWACHPPLWFWLGPVAAWELVVVYFIDAESAGKALDEFLNIYVPVCRKTRVEVCYRLDEIIRALREVQALMVAISRWVVLKSWFGARGRVPGPLITTLRVTLRIPESEGQDVGLSDVISPMQPPFALTAHVFRRAAWRNKQQAG